MTKNGQYVFAAVTRPRYFLESMKRQADICTTLEADPDNRFLKEFAQACSSDPAPRYPAPADFLQVASACLPGMVCDSFLHEQVAIASPGHVRLTLGVIFARACFSNSLVCVCVCSGSTVHRLWVR